MRTDNYITLYTDDERLALLETSLQVAKLELGAHIRVIDKRINDTYRRIDVFNDYTGESQHFIIITE
jgi:hypothetical protein